MKSFEQLARSAYAAYRQRQLDSGSGALAMQIPPWDQLTTPVQLDWIAVAKTVVAEMATVH
jgi:hypothetical protein